MGECVLKVVSEHIALTLKQENNFKMALIEEMHLRRTPRIQLEIVLRKTALFYVREGQAISYFTLLPVFQQLNVKSTAT